VGLWEANVGLDGVEFILAPEEAFQIAIPDEAAERSLTPSGLVSWRC
jgi:acyl carrier protein